MDFRMVHFRSILGLRSMQPTGARLLMHTKLLPYCLGQMICLIEDTNEINPMINSFLMLQFYRTCVPRVESIFDLRERS